MSQVGIESFPREQACRRCQELRFDNIFASLDDKETHGKLHLAVDYEIPTDNPPPSTELMRQIMDSCFPRLEDQKENTAASPTEGPRDAILIPKEEPMEIAQPEKPMEIQNEVPSGSSQSDHEEKQILDECLLCEFRCFRSERLEEHWSHVAQEHLETPGIFNCSQCQRTWDTPEPFGQHLLIHHPGQQASLLDRRDQGACNIFQMCFGVSEEAAGLKHLFQTPTEQKAPASEPHPDVPSLPLSFKDTGSDFKSKESMRNAFLNKTPKIIAGVRNRPSKNMPLSLVRSKICHVCGFTIPTTNNHHFYRWSHVAKEHAQSHLFSCGFCGKVSANNKRTLVHSCKRRHPSQACPVVDNRPNLQKTMEQCFPPLNQRGAGAASIPLTKQSSNELWPSKKKYRGQANRNRSKCTTSKLEN